MEEDYSPYCKHCSACGEEGCCSPVHCDFKEDGKYCYQYIRDLKFSYIMFEETYDLIAPEHKDTFDKIYDETYDIVYGKRDNQEE